MQVIVINGSPKGKYSVTLQSVRYIQKHHPEVEFEIFHVGQHIRAIEKDPQQFERIVAAVQVSDCVLWSYPVYTFLVPYQLVQFIDLVSSREQTAAFAGKYAVQLSTSKHFYDHTAYNYIHQICEDLGMKHLPGHCADMDDLTTDAGRQRLLTFAEEWLGAVTSGAPVTTKYAPVQATHRPYVSPPELPDTPKTGGYKITLVTDCAPADSNLQQMIETYRKALPNELRVVQLDELGLQGGCLGCFRCAIEGQCVYKDGFAELHREAVLGADCVILAASIKNHWFNPIWKCYDDRQFYNGHRISMMGKSIGYIISGPLRQEDNLREVLEARSEVGHLYLLDIVTDEYASDQEITDLLVDMARKTMWALEKKPQRPAKFLGVGGMKVFRDLIYIMQGFMQEDHRFYARHGLYDFPQKQIRMRLRMSLVGLALKSKRARQRASRYMQEVLIKQYEDAIRRY